MSWSHKFINLLTISRIPLTVIVFYHIWQSNYPFALTFFLLAIITDWIDGPLARKFKLTTPYGENVLEPMADGMMVFIPLIALVKIGAIPLSWFLLYCLIGLLSHISRYNFKKYNSKLQFLQIIFFLFLPEVFIISWLVSQIGRFWIFSVLIFYGTFLLVKKSRARVLLAYWER